MDNGASPEAETVASAESKEESVPALSEDKASDGETGTETPQPSGGAPSGGEAKDSDAQEAQKANESPQSEAPSKPESEPAAQAPGKEETEKESGKKVEASFNMPDEDVIVRAQFKTTHSISVQSGCARVNSESTTRAKEGDKVTVVADSVRGKKFKSWTVNSGSISLSSTTEKEAVFTMPDEDVSVSATYEDATAGKPELSLNGNAQSYLVINADFNGAANILRKAIPDAWNETYDFRFLAYPESVTFRRLNRHRAAV